MKQLNCTSGPWRIGDAGHTIFRPDRPSAIATICKQDEWRANAALIAEAGTVFHETGLTPRQLADQRAELLEALGYWFDSRATAAELAKRARAAIARATDTTTKGE